MTKRALKLLNVAADKARHAFATEDRFKIKRTQKQIKTLEK